jgi:superfamily I DNA/RNA helicase
VGRQSEVLYLPPSGHVAVLGTAGSGKTTLALLRSEYLASPDCGNAGRVLLLTFNSMLAKYLASFREIQQSNIDVRHYHHFAKGYLSSRGKLGPSGDICQAETFIESAANELAENQPSDPTFRRPLPFLVDEIAWLARLQVGSRKEYVESERSGRHGTRLARKDRPSLWALRERYIELRTEAGYRYDWDDIASAVQRELAADTSSRVYKHIVIDEGQDFSPAMLKSLVNAVDPAGSITLFADMAQQIYGHRLSWRDGGLNIKKVWLFQQNYRNTRQVAAVAKAISEMPYFADTDDMVLPDNQQADGPKPVLMGRQSVAEEFDFAVEQAKRLVRTGSVAILLPTRARERGIAERLGSATSYKLHKSLPAWQHGSSIYYGTYASAKGLEFQTVILPDVSDGTFPSAADISGNGQDEALRRTGKLFYVAVTRAKVNLLITYAGRPSALIPRADGLWDERP